jgi:hypothetical protein
MKRINKYLAGIIGIVIIVGAGWYYAASHKPSSSSTASDSVQVNPNTINVSLKVDSNNYAVAVNPGATVLDVMKKAADQGFAYSGQDSASMGYYVDEVNGVKNNNDKGQYWSFYINDKMAQAGISTQTVQAGDTITWKYESMK